MTLRRPRVLITSWRRVLPTFLGPTDLFTLEPTYADAVRRSGGLPVITPHLDDDELAELLDDVDAVVVSGGQDMDPACYGAENTSSRQVRPESDDFDMRVVRAAVERGLPVLGVCRGIQVINVAFGGDLRQEVQSAGDADHPLYAEMTEMDDVRAHRHEIEVREGSRVAAVLGTPAGPVNSLHHQGVGRLAEPLEVTATSADGTIEAVESKALDIVAVQWHPEMMGDEDGDLLFVDLVERARAKVGAAR